MFLTERIISLLTYALALFVAYKLIGNTARKQYKYIFLAYLFILAVFAFNYKPYVTDDLYRLREYIQYWIYKDWDEAVLYSLNTRTPTWVIYSYILSKLENINWLQTVTCIWCFGNVFYIVVHEIERNKIQGRYRSQLLFIIMAVGTFYLQTISGIRSMLGISIVSFCLYRETIERRRIFWHFPIWLFAALLHTSTMVLVISRFLLLLVQGRGIARKVMVWFGVLFIAALSYEYLGSYIVSSFEYGQGYLENSQEYTYSWEIIIGLIETCETVYILIMYYLSTLNKDETETKFGYKSLYIFTLIWTIVCSIALPFSYNIFRRYTILCTITSIPLVARLFKSSSNEKVDAICRTLFVFSLIIFILSGIRGDLCGYKFFILD